MEMILSAISLVLSFFSLVLLLILLFRKGKGDLLSKDDIQHWLDKDSENILLRLKERDEGTSALLESRFQALKENQQNALLHMEQVLSEKLLFQEKTLREILQNLEKDFTSLQAMQEKKLAEIQGIVDTKLQKALDDRLATSFKNIGDQLSGVYKAVGEMTRIGKDVSSLKNVLTNVKTTGILGEVQLGNILEDILTTDQYEKNIATKKNSRDVVEFAIKLPGKEQTPLYLPIDSKFPLSAYSNVCSAREEGDKVKLEAARKELHDRILLFSKDIETKYIDVPNTTDFAILFLPSESLYEEVLSLDLLSECQRKFHIVLAGPSTLSAFLNALSMGFKTLAIERKTSEVHRLLGNVKAEFTKFSDVLTQALKSLDLTRNRLEDLVGTRTRKIVSSLRSITLPEEEAEKTIRLGEDISLE